MKYASAILIFALAVPASAQSPTAFDAASIRPTEHGKSSPEATGYSYVKVVNSSRLEAQNSSLDELIRWAWQLDDNQVSGPVWLNDYTIAFDIAASAPVGTTDEQMHIMLQTLLAERFKLTTHRENKTLSGYVLLSGEKGVKLTPADPAGRRSTGGGVGINATKVTMDDFARYLARNLKMPVVDKTGIAGAFDIHFLFVRDPDANSAPSLFDALRQETGLRLQPAKVTVNILVIDHVEKSPTAN